MLTITITPIGTKECIPYVNYYKSSLFSMINLGWKLARTIRAVYGSNIKAIKDTNDPDAMFYGIYVDNKFVPYIYVLVEETPNMEDACPA